MKPPKGQDGLTLIELIVVVVLVGVLAAMAVPGSTRILDSGQRSAEINSLLGFFAQARREAVMSGQVHTLCPLDAANTCAKDWNQPVYLFADPMNERKLTENTRVVRVLAPPTRGHLTMKALSESYFQYQPSGMARGNLGNITWCPPDADTELAAHLVISRGGRVRVLQLRNSAGVPVKANGDPVEC